MIFPHFPTRWIWLEAELAKIDAFLKDMRDLFDEVDVDGSGFVTRVELSQWPGMAGMARHEEV